MSNKNQRDIVAFIIIYMVVLWILIVFALVIVKNNRSKIPCSFPDPQFSGAEPKDYHVTDCAIE